MNEDVTTSPVAENKRSNTTGILIWFFIILLLLIGGSVALYLLSKQDPLVRPAAEQMPTTTPPSPTEIPSPTASISGTLSPEDLGAVNIRVLNGSGTSGSAQQVASALREAGFTAIITGNAGSFGYEGITLQMTEEGSSYLPYVRQAITEARPGETVETEIDDTLNADIIVIVGQEL